MSAATDKPADDAIVLSEKRAETLVDAACHIQEQMRAIRVLADSEEDADTLRALMRTLSVLAQDLARNISFALGNPARFNWNDLFMKVYGRVAEPGELKP